MAPATSTGAYDRVAERRRAVALASHFREEQGLSIAQFADRLGRSPATIKAYFYDPTGEKARTVKARYQGVCRGCGAYTQPRNGKATRTRTARPVIRARLRADGRASAYLRRCATGRLVTASCRRRTTGHARTRVDAGERRSRDWLSSGGQPPARSAPVSGLGPPPGRRRWLPV